MSARPQSERRMRNVPSKLLTQEENEAIVNMIGNKCSVSYSVSHSRLILISPLGVVVVGVVVVVVVPVVTYPIT